MQLKKRNHFPIAGDQVKAPQRNRSEWHADSESLLAEKPLLLNPELDEPGDHLIFLPDGTVVEKDGSQKGKITIEICDLNRESLVAWRKELVERYRAEIMRGLMLIRQLDEKELASKSSFLNNLVTIFDPIFSRLKEAGDPSNEYSRLGWTMFNYFHHFFIDPIPEGEAKRFLPLLLKPFVNQNRL